MKKLIGKIKCKLGWHDWHAKIQDYLDQFGCIPSIWAVPMNARCKRCNKIYGDGTSKKTR
jgi:hypothetical protein